MKRILDSSFRYVPSHATDIRQTFERIRQEQQQREADAAQEKADKKIKVIVLDQLKRVGER